MFKKILSTNHLKWLGLFVSVISIIWFGKELLDHSSLFEKLSFTTAVTLITCSLNYLIAFIFIGIAWQLLLLGSGEIGSTYILAISITCLAQIGKYLPGNIGQHIGRVVLSKQHSFNLRVVLFTMFIETVWVIAIASLFSLLAIYYVGGRIFTGIPQIPQWWLLACLILIALLSPIISHRVFNFISHWWAINKGAKFHSMRMPSFTTFWLVGILYVLNFMVLGYILSTIGTQIFESPDNSILLLSAIFAAAWITGFITPGAPAGIGVREVVLVAALTPIYGKEIAIGIAAVLRIVTVLGDGLAFLIGLVLSRYAEPVVVN